MQYVLHVLHRDGKTAEPTPLYRFGDILELGALGDIFGSTMEGLHVSTRDEAQLGMGLLTDDTLLTVATAQSIAEEGRADPEAIAASLLSAYQQGIPGLGSTTLGALQALAVGQHWALAGIGGDRAAGNGAAIRIAPVALVTNLDKPGGRQLLRDVARITHRNDEATTGALAFGLALQMAMNDDASHPATLLKIAEALPDTIVRDRLLIARDFMGTPDEALASLGSSGYVAESVPLAIWLGFRDWPSPVDALRFAALHADDADSVASMTGQLLGARGYRLSDEADGADSIAVRVAREVWRGENLPDRLWRLKVSGVDPAAGKARPCN